MNETFKDFDPTKALKSLEKMSNKCSPSSARYATWPEVYPSDNSYEEYGPCFHRISSLMNKSPVLAVTYMGYGGFKGGDNARFRKADMEDLTTDQAYPFHLNDKCHYNEYSLEWLRFMLDPEGPFRAVLPHLYETDPEKVQEQRGFIFPDAQQIPAKLVWCFLIASRIGVANARVFWTYLLLKDMGVHPHRAALMAGGFAPEVVPDGKGGFKPSGRIIKSYTAGWLGVDTTAYARRFLDGDPESLEAFKTAKPHTNGSAKVFLCDKVDLVNMRFDTWEDAEKHTMDRYAAQVAVAKAA